MCNGGLNENDTIFVYKFYHNVKFLPFHVGIGPPRTFYAQVEQFQKQSTSSTYGVRREKTSHNEFGAVVINVAMTKTASFLAGN